MPSSAEKYVWRHRYERNTPRPLPANHDLGHNWRVIGSIANPNGGFNGGIDLVHNKVNRELAVCKRLRPRPGCIKHDLWSWRHEMLILRKLSHPNIPHYIDGFYTPKCASIYMQPCRLGSVSDFIDSRNMKMIPFNLLEFFLWHILHEVAQAVLYLQTGFKTLADADRSRREKVKGWVTLVHGDIRPDQIFLTNTETEPGPFVLLGDFGFSQFIKPWHDTEVHNGPGGPSASKPPEFPKEISADTDVFGIGATAQLFLVPDEKVKTGLQKGWSRKLGLSRELDALICRCVARHPLHRPTIRELLEKLEDGLAAQRDNGFDLDLLSGPLFKCLYSFPTTSRTGYRRVR